VRNEITSFFVWVVVFLSSLKEEFSFSQYCFQFDSIAWCFRSEFIELDIAKAKESLDERTKQAEIVNTFEYLEMLLDLKLARRDYAECRDHVDWTRKQHSSAKNKEVA